MKVGTAQNTTKTIRKTLFQFPDTGMIDTIALPY